MCYRRGQFLGGLTPSARAVLGFPALESSYWSAVTVAALKQLYGGLVDVGPYAEAVKQRGSKL